MGRTIADELIDKGREEERKEARKKRKEEAVQMRRQILLKQLQRRFGALPSDTVAAIESNKSVEELDAWLERFAEAATLDDMGIKRD